MSQRSPLVRAVAPAFLLVAVTAAGASAQQGRIRGVIVDETGQAVKGATVLAENANNFGPTRVTATTDDKGRFSIIGLRLGQWRLAAQAPGYALQIGIATARPIVAVGPPLTITLKRSGPATMGVLANISAKELQSQLVAADALLAQNDWDGAIAAYRAVVARAPSLTAVHLQIAAAYRGKKDYDAALAAYKTVLTADPAHEASRMEMAKVHLERGDARSAEETLLQAAAAETAGSEVLHALGELMMARGETSGATDWFAKAAAADPWWGKPRYRLGELALTGGDRERAAKLMDEVIAVDPQSPEAALAKTALDQMNGR
jgi:tetratricopeptide (TPR) repeat protein